MPGGPVDAVLARLADARKATSAQVIFLWVLAKGAVIVTYANVHIPSAQLLADLYRLHDLHSTTSKEERMKEYLASADLREYFIWPSTSDFYSQTIVAVSAPLTADEVQDIDDAGGAKWPVAQNVTSFALPSYTVLIGRLLVIFVAPGIFYGIRCALGI